MSNVDFKKLVETIVTNIVDDQDAVRVSVVEGATTVLIELSVAPQDKGKVIGREGSMAWAIRTIVSNVATRLGKKTVLHIVS